jgi:hypothetical protein
MLTFYQYLKEVATSSLDSPEGTKSIGDGQALNYDWSNKPPTKKDKRKKSLPANRKACY